MYPKEDIVILGAGLAGLSAAYHLQELGLDYQIFEREKSAGGLCRSSDINGFTFDYTGHLLYFRTKYTFKLVNSLIGGNLRCHRRNSWVFSRGIYTRYPFQANTYGLPPGIIKECILGLIEARRLNEGKNNRAGNFEEWIFRTFGDGIARYFMLPYNEKFWTVDPRELTCEWLDGYVPVPSLEETLTGALSDFTKPFGYNQEFWYPLKGGIGELALSFKRRLKKVRTLKEVIRIDLKKRRVKFKDGEVISFDRLISTLPVIEMIGLLKDVPSGVADALRRLRYTSIFNLNIGIDRESVSDKHWVYFPEQRFIFYRVGFPGNFSSSLTLPGKSSLYIEVSYSRDEPIDKKKIVQRIINDLIKAGLISKRDKIIAKDIKDIKYGYIVYDRNHRQSTGIVLDFLAKNHVYSIGRYGRWRYMSMEDVILDGKQVTKQI
jgi:protoporphyrinogen oxidase